MIQTFLKSLFGNSETKPFYQTSEFWVFVGAEATLATELLPTKNPELKSILMIGAGMAYKLARGLAKAGVKPS